MFRGSIFSDIARISWPNRVISLLLPVITTVSYLPQFAAFLYKKFFRPFRLSDIYFYDIAIY